MHPRMSAKEYELFLAFVRNSENYVEFGSGGSTFVASKLVKTSILSVDSSSEWLEKVMAACAPHPVQPTLVHIDIGPTGNWGFPANDKQKADWPAYSQDVWGVEGACEGDLYMIDGRFRVACFAQTVLHCRPDALIAIHDFASRPYYHDVHAIARMIASAEEMAIFRPRQGAQDAARNLAQAFQFEPA